MTETKIDEQVKASEFLPKGYTRKDRCKQARVQEFARGGAQNLKAFFFFFFFFAFQFFRGGGPAQKLAEKMIFSTKKVAKYR